MTNLAKNNEQGRSMVEMLGVLAIIGVLSVGGISGYSKAMAKFKLTKAQDQITMLLMNIRTAYATSPSYTGLSSKTAADYNIAPGEMVSGENLYGAFGGEVIVKEASPNTYFYITMKALGKEACRSLLSSDWGADGLVTITTGTTDAASATTCVAKKANKGEGHFCTAHLPVSLTDAATVCDNEVNTITWTYY